MRKRILYLALGLLLISLNAFADGNCNLAGSSLSGGVYLYNVLTGSGTDDSPYIFANTGRKLFFGTNGNTATPYMIIDTTGNVGIGTTTPATKLDVNGTMNSTNLNVSGNVGIGTTTPATKLDVIGDVRLGNSNSSCTSANEGAMHYNSTTKKMEFCNGSTWLTVGSSIVQTIDLQVASSADDCSVKWNGSSWLFYYVTDSNATTMCVGNYDSGSAKRGGGMRFVNVPVPSGAVITKAYLTFTSANARAQKTVNSYIRGNLVPNPSAFSTLADYKARRGTVVGGANDNYLTNAQVAWDNIGAWATDTDYNSPEIKTIIQELVNQAGWIQGNAIVLFWDDHNGRSSTSTDAQRAPYSYDASSGHDKAPRLHIEYQVP